MRNKVSIGESADYQISDLKEGDTFSFYDVITGFDVDSFAELSGDYSPLHTSKEYALKAGFSDRVAHGVLVASMVSRLIGMHLPGKKSIISNINLKFKNPIIIETPIEVAGRISEISNSVKVAILKVEVKSLDGLLRYVSGDVIVRVRD